MSKRNPAPFEQKTDCINTKIIKFIEKKQIFLSSEKPIIIIEFNNKLRL